MLRRKCSLRNVAPTLLLLAFGATSAATENTADPIAASSMLTMVVSAYIAFSIIGFARCKPAYSHITHTISELGEYGSRYTKIVSLGVFLPIGLILGTVTAFLYPAHPPVAMLAFSLAAGYTIAALFPCDPGSPLSGSVRQGLHNLGGGIEYVGGAFALIWIAESYGPAFRVAGALAGISAILLSFQTPLRGIIQRISESLLLGGLLAALWLS